MGDEMNTIDKILITLASFVFGFTITMIVIFCVYQVTPDTLIECVFACCSSEAVITFAIWWIKKKANRKDKDNGLEK
jgi:hypothetical protein